MDNKYIALILFSLSLFLFLSRHEASAACSDWLRQVALPKLGCSPQDIEQICASLRPVPQGTTCAPQASPAVNADGSPYQQFQNLAEASHIDLSLHPTYTENYFESRANLFCGLLNRYDMMRLTHEITFPPVINWTEATRDRSRLEAAILRIGTKAFCPAEVQQAAAWEATYER
jgi:hypothetical protein